MKTQHMLTYGLSRSPMRAHVQNIPKTLFCSALSPACPAVFVERIVLGCSGGLPVLVAIHYPRKYVVGVCACADEEEDDEEKGRLA